MAAVRMNQLGIDTGLTRNVGEIVMDAERSQAVFQGTAIVSAGKAHCHALAAERTDRSGDIDAASANLDKALRNAVYRSKLDGFVDNQRPVNRWVQRYGYYHG